MNEVSREESRRKIVLSIVIAISALGTAAYFAIEIFSAFQV